MIPTGSMSLEMAILMYERDLEEISFRGSTSGRRSGDLGFSIMWVLTSVRGVHLGCNRICTGLGRSLVAKPAHSRTVLGPTVGW